MTADAWLTRNPVAHRGLHDREAGRLENTLAAAEAAAARGFAVECDLQLTADDVPVVFHDGTLERLAGAAGRIAETSLAALRAVRLSGTDAGIPTLAELLETIAGRVPLFAEIKRQARSDRRLEAETARVLAGYRGAVALMSFDPGAVKAMRRLAPDRPRGLVASRSGDAAGLSPTARFALRNLLFAPAVGAQFVAYRVDELTSAAPRLARRLGLPLLAWTVRDERGRRMAQDHADQMIFEGFDPG